jgi:hypothetical protein
MPRERVLFLCAGNRDYAETTFLSFAQQAGTWSVTRVPCPGWLEISTFPP